MSNNRIYYAIQQVSIRPQSLATYYPVHGLQSCAIATNFNLVQAFEYGQISLYENIEEIPDVQMTLNKVLDGYLPIYCLATADSSTPTLIARANQKCNPNLTIYDEVNTSATGTPIGQMEASGMYVNSIRYQFPVDGNFTEEVVLVGNTKVWKNDSKIVNLFDNIYASGLSDSGHFNGLDSPLGAGGINRRQDMQFVTASGGTDVNGMAKDPHCTILPPDVAGIGSNGVNTLTSATRAHLRNINISVNLNREAINELGRRSPYFRTPTLPVEVTSEISITATSGDMISASESGILSDPNGATCQQESGNLLERTIRVATCEGLRVYTGVKNKLASVNYGGGDAGGGYVEVSYTYRTFNDFTVMHSGEQLLSTTANTFWGNSPTYLCN